ncbi:uncharacterized protein G2W53_024161 [Senna tora]|uniref:Uncharacterized protein n=1 Tax=Senna tora TaxID=362788 RepID=A0A834WGQ0_9FABA|nr:uncharacterized protein G2W53_024161 [Senna tora]
MHAGGWAVQYKGSREPGLLSTRSGRAFYPRIRFRHSITFWALTDANSCHVNNL